MSVEWWVDKEDLDTRPRTGGVDAIKGFDFQKGYALLHVTWLLLGRHGVVEVRYEGAQDVDVRFGSGRQLFVQAKNYSADLTVAELHKVMAGFAQDVVSAKARGCSDDELPIFRLVSTRIPHASEGGQVFNASAKRVNVQPIVDKMNPKYSGGLTNSVLLEYVNLARSRSSLEVVLRDHALDDFHDQACWALVEFGVPVEHVEASLARIDKLLIPRASLQLNDVAAVLKDLPDGHFGLPHGPCGLLPCRRELPAKEHVKQAFWGGVSRHPWGAAAYGLGVERTASSEIGQELEGLFEVGGMLVIEGGSGTGKSILARRLAWDLHRSGACIVLDVNSPDRMEDKHWNVIVGLCHLSKRPLLLVVDDVWHSDKFIEGLGRHARTRLCVLATSQSGKRPEAMPVNIDPHNVELGALDADEQRQLYALLGTAASLPGSRKSLAGFASKGQIFALSLALQNGSLKKFATRLIEPLRTHTSHLNGFIDLCTGGVFDQTIATSILKRRALVRDYFWKDERYEHLVSLSSDGDFERLGGPHSLVAREVLKLLGISFVQQAIALCKTCDASVREERRFALYLLTNYVKDTTFKKQCLYLKDDIVGVLNGFTARASYADLHRIHNILKALGQTTMADECILLATGDKICEPRDISLALATQEGFAKFFEVILALYESGATELGPGKFLKAARFWGTDQQLLQLADFASGWLQIHGFPAEDTRHLFEMGNVHPATVGVRVLPLLESFSHAPDLPVDTALAVVLLVVKLDGAAYLPALRSRFMADLLAVTGGWSDKQVTLALKLAGLTKLWSSQAERHVMCQQLMQGYTNVHTRPLRIALIQVALSLASIAHMSALDQLVQELITQRVSKATKALQKQFNQRSATLSASGSVVFSAAP